MSLYRIVVVLYICSMKSEKDRLVDKAFKKVCAKVVQYIYKVELLKDGDHILVGLSGGKDSYLLLEVLAECKRRLPYSITVSAIHVALDNVSYKVDTSYMQKLCSDHGIPFYLVNQPIEEESGAKKGMCFVCSWTRRKLIFEQVHKLCCTKLAFGHHMDDAVQTMLMNQIWHGTISSMPCSLSMLDGEVDLIRPLLSLSEEEVVAYTSLRCYPPSMMVCPHDDKTKRQAVRDIMAQIKSLNGAALKNMFRSMENIFPEYLPKSGKPAKERNTENLIATKRG